MAPLRGSPFVMMKNWLPAVPAAWTVVLLIATTSTVYLVPAGGLSTTV